MKVFSVHVRGVHTLTWHVTRRLGSNATGSCKGNRWPRSVKGLQGSNAAGDAPLQELVRPRTTARVSLHRSPSVEQRSLRALSVPGGTTTRGGIDPANAGCTFPDEALTYEARACCVHVMKQLKAARLVCAQSFAVRRSLRGARRGGPRRQLLFLPSKWACLLRSR